MDLLDFELLALPLLGSAIGAAGATVVAVGVDAAAGAGAGAGVDPPPPPPPAGGVVGVGVTGAIAAKPVAEYDVIDPSELVPVALNRTNLFTSKLADRYVLVFAPTIAEQSEGRVNDDAPPVVHEYHW
jgi:hypothetical protein